MSQIDFLAANSQFDSDLARLLKELAVTENASRASDLVTLLEARNPSSTSGGIADNAAGVGQVPWLL